MRKSLWIIPVLLLFAAALASGLAPTASADALIFDRGLPDSTNVNNAAGANRSNVSWGNQISNGNYFMVGDNIDLSLTPNTTGGWVINDIRVWEVANTEIGSPTSTSPPAGSDPHSEFSTLTLFLGAAYTTLTPVSSTYTSTFVQYLPGGLNYQGTRGGYFPLYQIDFSGLNILVPATENLGFAIDAVPNNGNAWFIHASNAALSGTDQEGFDNFYELYCGNSATPGASTSASYCDLIDSNGNGFDKSSDINVEVFGSASATPEPATFGLFGAGLLGLIRCRRRK
jgi:PEP-CTERM motif